VKFALVGLFAATHAWAETKPEPKPDPAAIQAGDANLESQAPRKGLVFTFAAGGGVTLGFGVRDSTGTGGAALLRLAHVATPRTLVTLELTGSGLLHQVKEGMGTDAETTTYVNQVTNILVGAQIYANPALWFRIAGGFGRYFGDHVTLESKPGQPRRIGDIRLAGPAVSVGAGVDFVRLKRVRLGVELLSTGMINREGMLSSGGFLFGITVD
jgi:hypothetical protein